MPLLHAPGQYFLAATIIGLVGAVLLLTWWFTKIHYGVAIAGGVLVLGAVFVAARGGVKWLQQRKGEHVHDCAQASQGNIPSTPRNNLGDRPDDEMMKKFRTWHREIRASG